MAKVAILGAGNVALTLAGDLARRLGQVSSIWAPISNRNSFNSVRSLGSLELVGPDYGGDFQPQLEDDLETAISGAAFIFLTVPTMGQQGILCELANFNLSSSVLVALPGSATSLACKQTLTPAFAPIAVIEATTSPYACRRVNAQVLMLSVKRTFEVASTQALSEEVRGLRDSLSKSASVVSKSRVDIFFKYQPCCSPCWNSRCKRYHRARDIADPKILPEVCPTSHHACYRNRRGTPYDC